MLFDDLTAFVTVAQLRSFSAASVRLRVAQSSLSKRVQRLEHHFGTPLFKRHGRGVSLTESGSTLLARAQKLLDEVADVERDVQGVATQPSGDVRIALPPATSPLLAPLIFEQCRQELPLVRPSLRESTSDAIHTWLSAGEVDLALMYNPEYGADFEIEPVMSEPLLLIAPTTDRETGQPIDYPASYPLSALATLPLILPRWPHSIRVLVERLCAGNSLHPNIEFESDSIRSTKGIVEKGFGCTLFSRAWLADDLDAGRLQAIPFSSPLMSWTLCIAHARRENLSPALMGVKRIMEGKIKELYRAGTWPHARLIEPEQN